MKLIPVIFIVLLLVSCNKEVFQRTEGGIYGTSYHISYQSEQDLTQEIRQEMERVNASLSMFNPNSVVAKINRGESDEVDSLFNLLWATAIKVNRATDGAFDVTVAPLVNLWGFGYKNDSLPTSEKVDLIMEKVGMDKLSVENGRITKKVEGVEIDASAIAKGLGVDLVAEYFDSKGITNYMVEIGGEVRVKGHSDKKRPWRIGIDKPQDDSALESRELEMVLNLSDGALATSGNYRNFYIRDGKKYAHTINPHTGYPVQMDIVSSSVFAPTCMESDAYATAFMVLGFEESCRIVEENPKLQACFMYTDNDTLKIWMSDGFKQLVLSND